MLLDKDFYDGAGIRIGFMDCYAILGEAEKAIQFSKKFTAFSEDMDWDEYAKEKQLKSPNDWIRDSDMLIE